MPHRPAFAMPLCTAALACACASVQAQSLLLDAFDGPTERAVYWTALDAATATLLDHAAAAVPGGVRTLSIGPDPARAGTMAGNLSGAGTFWFFAYGGQSTNLTLSYGALAPLNLDLSGQAALALDVWFASAHKLTVYAYTNASDPTDNPAGSSLSIDLGELDLSDYSGTVVLPFSAFAAHLDGGGGVNWGDVDLLAFSFAAAGIRDPHQVALRSIIATPVPEPATWGSMALGLAALTWRCRRPRAAAPRA